MTDFNRIAIEQFENEIYRFWKVNLMMQLLDHICLV